MNWPPSCRESSNLGAREFDDLGPLLRFVCDERAKNGERDVKHGAAQGVEPRLDLWVSKSCVDFLAEHFDDFDGSVLGSAHAIPGARLVARHEIAHGW